MPAQPSLSMPLLVACAITTRSGAVESTLIKAISGARPAQAVAA